MGRRLNAWLAALAMVASSSAIAADVRGFWLPSSPDLWERAGRGPGLRLTNNDGVVRVVPALPLRNMVDVARDLERTSGVRAQIGLVDSDSPTAAAIMHKGTPTVVITLTWLQALGADRDAMATVIGHELAHLKLGHKGRTQYTGGPLSFVMNAMASSFALEEERTADDLGLRWASEAGYDACGLVRAVGINGRLASGNYPSPADRIAAAEAVSQRPCALTHTTK